MHKFDFKNQIYLSILCQIYWCLPSILPTFTPLFVSFLCMRTMLITVLHMKQLLNLSILCKGLCSFIIVLK